MRRINASLILASLLVFGSSAHAQTPAAFRILFGVTDTGGTRWDGTWKITPASECSIEPWRFEGVDNVVGDVFHLTSHPGHQGGTPVANGFILTVKSVVDASEFSFSTSQGAFAFRASEVPFGRGIYKLGGRVYVDRVPVTARLTRHAGGRGLSRRWRRARMATSGWLTCSSITVPTRTSFAPILPGCPRTSKCTRSPPGATRFGRGNTRAGNGAKILP